MSNQIVTIEKGVAFFQDGTEVSNVSLDSIAAIPDLVAALKDVIEQIKAYDSINGKNSCPICPEAAINALAKTERI